MTEDLTTATPAEIDTELAALYGKLGMLDGSLRYRMNRVESSEERTGAALPADHPYRVELDEIRAERDEIQTEIDRHDAEFDRRGGWSRYFLVPGGHVHRERHCSTCFPTTQFSWLPNLSDCDETTMVDEYGETACTICFPDAPTLPGWARSVEEREAAEAAKKATQCPGSKTRDYAADQPRSESGVILSTRLYRPWAVCAHCGNRVSVTSVSGLRTHKP